MTSIPSARGKAPESRHGGKTAGTTHAPGSISSRPGVASSPRAEHSTGEKRGSTPAEITGVVGAPSPVENPRVAQQRAALVNANRVRIAEKDVRGRLKRGEVTPLDVLADPQPPLSGWHALEFLRHCPQIGAWKIERFGRDAMRYGINVAVPLGRMSAQHRYWMARWVTAGMTHRATLMLDVAPPDWTEARRAA